MKRTQFTEEQIIAVLREAESGAAVKELCRRAGISAVTFYRWKSKFEGSPIPMSDLALRPPELPGVRTLFSLLAL